MIDTTQRIEPARLEALPEKVTDLVAELASSAANLGNRLHPLTAANLADVVRIMNSYYSNLIEGNNTRPRDIERALAGDLEADPARRNLQIEAASHVRVQAAIDQLARQGALPEPASVDFIRWLHREFYRDADPSMLVVTGAGRDFNMVPGEWRSRPEHDVAVGRHIPPASPRVDEFMRYLADRYQFNTMGMAGKVVCMAISHHRFNFIHPFPDGNGRVSRLMSHAMAWHAGIAAGGLWSISRGLARGLASRGEYNQMMDLADSVRESDLDGRGNLSQKALIAFISWFLEVALDQVRFMSGLFELEALSRRLRALARELLLPAEAEFLLDTVMQRGEIDRGEVPRVTGLPERSARRVLNALVQKGLLASTTPKGAVSLRFPASSLEILFPRLFPQI
ncbi:MAG: Fic family protein [Acidobacteria bacterium]|nr:Fic family protein [Acidobacteriota bacterium]MSO60998.1 Fic family protein [Acidobacteriota bacterium]